MVTPRRVRGSELVLVLISVRQCATGSSLVLLLVNEP